MYRTIKTASHEVLTHEMIQARSLCLDEKIMEAERRSFHTFFDVHVIENDDFTYSVFEEGDYGNLPNHLIDSVVYTTVGKMDDEY